MSIKEIIKVPNPFLKIKAKPVINIDMSIINILEDMLETMYNANGIGLAAIQVGILKRVVVIDISRDENKKDPLYLINPVITHQSKETSVYEEGCLSLPGQFAEIERPANCMVKYIDYNGKEQEIKADGLLATCIQHEMDHL